MGYMLEYMEVYYHFLHTMINKSQGNYRTLLAFS